MEGNNIISLDSKKDYENLLIRMSKDVIPYFSPGNAFVFLPNYRATSYDDKTIFFESFARITWGVGPYSKHNGETDFVSQFKKGILNGTDPNHPEYWGDLGDYDQRIVEMVPISIFLYFSKESFWDKITMNQRKNIESWLLQCNKSKTGDNNWLYFGIIVNTILKILKCNYNDELILNNFKKIDEFYLGEGWYSDGKSDRIDYYTSFSIHFYSLIYAKIMEKDDPKRSALCKNRASIFAKQFIYWFSEDGSAVPFGRSLTYKFAQVAFWSAVLYADIDVFSVGVIKGIINRNLRWWLSKSIFDKDGLLSIGYTYTNINMSEDYNGPGSSYWAFKVFLILAIDEHHEIWKVKEETFPELRTKKLIDKARMIISHDNSHVGAFINGQKCENQTHAVAKYEKFVYSNIFGFSVPRSMFGVAQGAFDSTLIVSEDKSFFIPKNNSIAYFNNEFYMFSKWQPIHGVDIESYLVPCLPWHVRIFKIKTNREIYVQDAGFCIERKSHLFEAEQRNLLEIKNGLSIKYNNYHSGIVSLIGNGIPEVIFPSENTNLIYPRTELPVLSWKLKKGNYILVDAILGDYNDKRYYSNYWDDIPSARKINNRIDIILNGEVISINLDKKYLIPSSFGRRKKIFIRRLKQILRRL